MTAEQLFHEFWDGDDDLQQLLPSTHVITGNLQDQDQQPTYATVNINTSTSVETSSSRTEAGELAFEVFADSWEAGRNIVSTLKNKLLRTELTSGAAVLQIIRFDNGSYSQQPDGVWHFIHTYDILFQEN
jgi:hypothetical protein